MSLLFVYGTLKRGDVRQRDLGKARFLAEAVTAPRYRLLDCGEYPALIEVAPGRGLGIEGELYEVSLDQLKHLDEVEAVEEGLYRRASVTLAAPHQGLVVETYFYLPATDGLPDCGVRWTRRAPKPPTADA